MLPVSCTSSIFGSCSLPGSSSLLLVPHRVLATLGCARLAHGEDGLEALNQLLIQHTGMPTRTCAQAAQRRIVPGCRLLGIVVEVGLHGRVALQPRLTDEDTMERSTGDWSPTPRSAPTTSAVWLALHYHQPRRPRVWDRRLTLYHQCCPELPGRRRGTEGGTGLQGCKAEVCRKEQGTVTGGSGFMDLSETCSEAASQRRPPSRR